MPAVCLALSKESIPTGQNLPPAVRVNDIGIVGMAACCSKQTLKSFKTLPVTIVEDHNEVIPHIYRAIGSKHLPMSNISLIHFDSHPDLLIPYDFPADNVYNKEELFESLSIENWILPAVYAGHITNIYWIKPPWAEQLMDKTVEFFVGRCQQSGCIRAEVGPFSHERLKFIIHLEDFSDRTSCQESYFVSEILYVPEKELENKKKVKLTVVTVGISSSESRTNSSEEIQSETVSPQHILETDIANTDSNRLSQPSTNGNGSESDQLNSKKLKVDGKQSNVEGYDISSAVSRGESIAQNSQVHGDISIKSVIEKFKEITSELKSDNFILDIDMDFFSTKNPFKEMFSEKQYGLLKELYRFQWDSVCSEETISECTNARKKQLSALKSVFTALAEEPSSEPISSDGSTALKELVEDLLSSKEEVDFNLVHEAGCTCDDTELPHHISTKEEIDDLMCSLKEILKTLPKPTIVTLSRSSDDDYCPQEQVEQIELKLLQVIENIYTDILVNFDYGVYSDSENT